MTTTEDAKQIGRENVPPSVQVAAVEVAGPLTAQAILGAVDRFHSNGLSVVECGPYLIGSFLAEHRLNALFLTIAPQIAGRDSVTRPGLVAGHLFAPEHPLWGTLASVKRAGSHLFLRYAFGSDEPAMR